MLFFLIVAPFVYAADLPSKLLSDYANGIPLSKLFSEFKRNVYAVLDSDPISGAVWRAFLEKSADAQTIRSVVKLPNFSFGLCNLGIIKRIDYDANKEIVSAYAEEYFPSEKDKVLDLFAVHREWYPPSKNSTPRKVKNVIANLKKQKYTAEDFQEITKQIPFEVLLCFYFGFDKVPLNVLNAALSYKEEIDVNVGELITNELVDKQKLLLQLSDFSKESFVYMVGRFNPSIIGTVFAIQDFNSANNWNALADAFFDLNIFVDYDLQTFLATLHKNPQFIQDFFSKKPDVVLNYVVFDTAQSLGYTEICKALIKRPLFRFTTFLNPLENFDLVLFWKESRGLDIEPDLMREEVEAFNICRDQLAESKLIDLVQKVNPALDSKDSVEKVSLLKMSVQFEQFLTYLHGPSKMPEQIVIDAATFRIRSTNPYDHSDWILPLVDGISQTAFDKVMRIISAVEYGQINRLLVTAYLRRNTNVLDAVLKSNMFSLEKYLNHGMDRSGYNPGNQNGVVIVTKIADRYREMFADELDKETFENLIFVKRNRDLKWMEKVFAVTNPNRNNEFLEYVKDNVEHMSVEEFMILMWPEAAKSENLIDAAIREFTKKSSIERFKMIHQVVPHSRIVLEEKLNSLGRMNEVELLG